MSRRAEKIIGCLFVLASVALILGQAGFALIYVLLAGYFAFRAKQLLSE